ncbi:MAG: HlyD family secretion protein [Verrucomicrobia bacterium]|nr:MAG: HlyD family secretion protein [Verrucomicrobiota bacterium]
MNANALKIEGLEPAGTDRAVSVQVKPATRTGTHRSATPLTPRKRRRATLGFALALLVLAAGYGGYRWWSYASTWVTTDNAYVAGHIHTVSTRVPGTVKEVFVSENQDVAAGALLARLDASDFKVKQAEARALLAQAEAQVAQARAQITREEAVANKAQLDFDRADRLIREANSLISKAEFDAAKASLDAARGSLGATRAVELAAQAQVQVATAQLADAELQLSYTDIVAPAAGRVGRKSIEAGNHVQPGQALLAVVQPEVWVTANLKETQLKHLRAGQSVKLSVDSLPDHEFTGRVESIAPASGAQFALLPPDNATGNFTKIVQRLPVKIVFDEASVSEFAGRLAPGMSVVVKVNTRS